MSHNTIRRFTSLGWARRSPRVGRVRQRVEAGMTTAEYAVGTIAACAFAGLLIVVIRSGPVKAMLAKVINVALGSAL